MWGILGQWDILLLNLIYIGFTNFFRCLIFDLSFFTNADVVTIKDEKICKTDAGPIDFHWFCEFFRCFIYEFFFFTNDDVATIKEDRETNGGKIKKQDVPLT